MPPSSDDPASSPEARGAEPAPTAADAGAREPAGERPDLEALLELEARARRRGTGLEAQDLTGLWRPERIWPRGARQGSALTEALLRGLSATLRIEPSASATSACSGGSEADGGPAEGLWLTNAVQLGPLALRFQGPGRLQGRRPLLLFRFERLELLAGQRVLFQRRLPAPDPRRQPFFALIATGPAGAWLAARGRSGGLAVWRKDNR